MQKQKLEVLPKEDLALIGLNAVLDFIGISRAQLYNYLRDGKFPAPLDMESRSVLFRVGDVRTWLESKQPRKRA